jgi:flagellar hook-length control protein FliK
VLGDVAVPNGAEEQHQGAGAPVDDAIGVVLAQSPSSSPPSHRETSADAEDRRDAPRGRWQDPPAGLERVGVTGAAGESSLPNAARAVAPARESISQMGMERVLSAARTSATHGGMEVRLRLHPEALGEVSVQIRWEGGVLSARLETATQAARDALENGAHALRTALQEQGIPVERLSVGIRLDLEARSHPQDPGPPPERGPAPELPPSGPVPSTAEAARESESAGRLDIRI